MPASRSRPAIAFAVLVSGVILFQLALAAGAPWGSVAMGGRYPGQFPPELRVAAVVQALVLAGLGLVVLARAEMILPRWHGFSRKAIWGVVAFSAVSTLLNLATPSAWERLIWGPVAVALLACSVLVARSPR